MSSLFQLGDDLSAAQKSEMSFFAEADGGEVLADVLQQLVSLRKLLRLVPLEGFRAPDKLS